MTPLESLRTGPDNKHIVHKPDIFDFPSPKVLVEPAQGEVREKYIREIERLLYCREFTCGDFIDFTEIMTALIGGNQSNPKERKRGMIESTELSEHNTGAEITVCKAWSNNYIKGVISVQKGTIQEELGCQLKYPYGRTSNKYAGVYRPSYALEDGLMLVVSNVAGAPFNITSVLSNNEFGLSSQSSIPLSYDEAQVACGKVYATYISNSK